MKILEILGENRRNFVEKWKIIKIWRMISIRQSKVRKLLSKPCTCWPGLKKTLKNSKNLYRNPNGNLTFFTFLTKYFLDLWLRSEIICPSKISPDFYKNISDFGVTFLRFQPPPSWRHWLWFCPMLKTFLTSTDGRLVIILKEIPFQIKSLPFRAIRRCISAFYP